MLSAPRPREYPQEEEEHKNGDHYHDDNPAEATDAELNSSEKSHPIDGGIRAAVLNTFAGALGETILPACPILRPVRPAEVERTLRKLDIRPSKRMGQHFLLDEDVAARQVVLASPLESETALEIGPGLGILTAPLVESFGEVVAVEKDRKLCSYLRERFPALGLIEGDALQAELPAFDKVVSNLPYEISSPITFRLLDLGFEKAVLMYQKEFAERLVAREGQSGYSKLSVVVAYRAAARVADIVPKEKFFPAPKVDSMVVEITPRDPPFRVDDEKHFLALVDVLFGHRRKKMGNSVLLHWRRFFDSEEEANASVKGAEWYDERVEHLSPAQIAGISNELTKD